MVASALPHLDGPHLRDWSRFDGSERAAALESAWRDLAVSCWKDLHQGEEPAAADLPDPADIAVFIDQESPLLGVAWDEFRVRWEELASRVISRATVREWANLELTIITRDTPGTETEFMVLQADTGKVRHLTAEEWENLPKLKRIGPGRFVSWDDFLSQNIMGAGAAHAQLINDVIDELRGAPGISPDKGAALLMVCDYYEGISPEVRGEHPAVPLIHAWQRTPEAERIRYVKADLRTRRRRMPANLRVGDRSHSQAGGAVQSALFDRGSAEPVGLQGQLPGIRDSGKAPALPLELWDLGAASATKGAGRGAPLPLGVLKAKLYPNLGFTHNLEKV